MLSLLWVTAQTSTTPDPTSIFASLGIASVICVVLSYGWWIEHKEKLSALSEAREARSECSTLQEERISRERELSTMTLPILLKVAEYLERVPGLVAEAQSSGRSSEIERLLRDIRGVIDDRRPGQEGR